ncbi:hypothetical protein ACFQXB_12245 [Plastorhodobacter daqingensis]|uniref:Uncharacterized protein n=1 Tax=Plastorhodobacter daqingensis TaxID=1387281 RepID=A0ABW2UJS5_9RHOB
MSIRRGVLPFVALGALLAPLPALAQEAPLSAIDWLSESVASPPPQPVTPRAEEPAITDSALPEEISTRPIDGPSRDATGLLAPSVTGLPRKLWGETSTDELIALIRAQRPGGLPAVQDLLYTLLMAEVDPPADSDHSGRLFLARVDKLLEFGALDPAMSLLELAGQDEPETFRRFFDVALLMGDEDRACDTMRATPEIAPTFQARIFCLARGGDWNAAALSLRTGHALGQISAEDEALLARFLDPELFEGEPDLVPPSRPTPLVWRMFEALGEPIPTQTLPVAFAQADLRANTGWKSQIEAAERLARLGAISPNRLLGLYTERVPAASGGVWDRVRAVQRLDQALNREDAPDVLAQAVQTAWEVMGDAELEVILGQLYGEALMTRDLPGPAGATAYRLALLSPAYEEAATRRDPTQGEERFLAGIARGALDGASMPGSMAAAIRTGLGAEAPPADVAALIEGNRIGEALLRAARGLNEAASGDPRSAADGLAALRHLGLEDVARRAALQLMILERRG